MAAPPEMNFNWQICHGNSYSVARIQSILMTFGAGTRPSAIHRTESSWWMRKMIRLGIEHIDIKQTLTGGIEASPDNQILNWEERSVKDNVFGHVRKWHIIFV